MRAFIIGIIFLTAYNISMVVKNILLFLRKRKYTEGILAILYLFLAPLLVYEASMLPEGDLKTWAGTFAVVIGLIWLVYGIVMDAYRKNNSRKAGKAKGPRPSGLRIILLFLVSVLLFYYGAFIGIENNAIRNIILATNVLLFFSAVFSFFRWWRYY